MVPDVLASGTVPLSVTAFRVGLPAATSTPSRRRICATSEVGKLSSVASSRLSE
jgi:hypothetical protein